jgi:hypothetical protein
MSFLLYISFFYMPEYLTDICLLHVDVGPVRPTDYAQNRCHPWPGAATAAAGGPAVAGYLPVEEAKRVLKRIE